jgi:hypothetical protein
MDMKRIGTTVASLVIASSLLGTCFSAIASATMRTSHPASVPRGWKTYTYGKAIISVPSDWAVERNHACPVRSAPGTLNLGTPKRPSECPAPEYLDANTVRLSPLLPSDLLESCPTISVNGLRVHVGPCGSSDPGGLVYYVIPSLGVQAVGTGTNNENVTGPGTGTVVGRVLHTLRR